MSRKTKTPSFEEAMEKLEDITRKLESGELPLDKSIEAYEEGMELKKVCQEMLEKAEKKLEYLERGQDGDVVRKPIPVNDSGEEVDELSTDQSRLFQKQ